MYVGEKKRAYHRQWMAKRRAQYFDGKCCAVCGSTENLELDHVDPATKVTHCVWSWSQERRKAELAKCQPLCRNCHREKSIREMREGCPPHGVTGYRNGCRCDVCRSAQRERLAHWRSRKKVNRTAQPAVAHVTGGS